MHQSVYGVLVVGTQGGIYRYQDDGTWAITTVTDTPITSISSATNGTLYAVSSEDSTLFKSADGMDWEGMLLESGIFRPVVPVNDTLLYANLQNSGLCGLETSHSAWHRSQDGGITWECLLDPMNPHDAIQYFHITEQGTLIASGRDGIFRSEDGGFEWIAGVVAGDTQGVFRHEIIGSSGPFILAGDSPDEYLLSKDDGKTWAQTPLTGSFQDILFTDQGELFATSYSVLIIIGGEGATRYTGDIFRSTDEGASWTALNFGDGAVNHLTQKGSVLFAASLTGMYRSLDQGISWSHDGDGLHNQDINDLAIAPDGAIYVAPIHRALLRTTELFGYHSIWISLPISESQLMTH